MSAETTPQTPAYTVADLRAAVDAGMAVAEAKALLDAGFAPDAVLELAVAQEAKRLQSVSDTQTATAKAMQKAMKPENTEHPGHSVFNYPEGEKARPKVLPPFEFSYNGYPSSKFPETEHWRDCELMAQVKPGVYTVLAKDGSIIKVDVVGERDASGNLTKVDVRFPVTRESKSQVPPQMVVLYQLVHPDNPRQRFLEAMNEFMRLTLWAAPVAV